MISLNLPVHIGLDPHIKLEHQNRTYSSILKASEITGLCINQIVYSVFNNQFITEEWYILDSRDFNKINKVHLTTLNTSKKINGSVFLIWLLRLKEKVTQLISIIVKSKLFKVCVLGVLFVIVRVNISHAGIIPVLPPSNSGQQTPFACLPLPLPTLPRLIVRSVTSSYAERSSFIQMDALRRGNYTFNTINKKTTITQTSVSNPSVGYNDDKSEVGSFRSRLRSVSNSSESPPVICSATPASVSNLTAKDTPCTLADPEIKFSFLTPEAKDAVSVLPSPASCTNVTAPFLSLGVEEKAENSSLYNPGTWTNHSENKLTDSEARQAKLDFTIKYHQYIVKTQLADFMSKYPNSTIEEQLIFEKSIDFEAIITAHNRSFFNRKYEQANRLIDPKKPLIYGFVNVLNSHFGVYAGLSIRGTTRRQEEKIAICLPNPTHNSKYFLEHTSYDKQESIVNFLIAGVVDITPDMSKDDLAFANNYLNTLIRENYKPLGVYRERCKKDPENGIFQTECKKEEIRFKVFLAQVETFVIGHIGIHEVLNSNASFTPGSNIYNPQLYDTLESASFNIHKNPHPTRKLDNTRINKLNNQRLVEVEKRGRIATEEAMKDHPFSATWLTELNSTLTPVQGIILKIIIVGVILKNYTGSINV